MELLCRAGDFPIVFGRYNLLGVLGEGGMARNTNWNRGFRIVRSLFAD
jgi:hypothetical protein